MNVFDLNRERQRRSGNVKPRNRCRPFGRGEVRGALPVSIGDLAKQIVDRLNKGR